MNKKDNYVEQSIQWQKSQSMAIKAIENSIKYHKRDVEITEAMIELEENQLELIKKGLAENVNEVKEYLKAKKK
jgi:hypothetical protein